jgi:hypothetical protein
MMVARTLGVVVLAAGSLAACLKSNSVQCADGRTCPAGFACDEIHHLCVLPDQLTSCVGKPDDAPCEVEGEPAICKDGVCIATVCGDGIVSPGEYCEVDPLPQDSCVTFGFDAGSIGCYRAACAPDVSQCARLKWASVIYKNTGVWAMWGTGTNNLFAVGDRGRISRWTGFGEVDQDSGTTADLRGVSGSASDNIFAVGGGRENCNVNNLCDAGQTCDPVTAKCQGGGGVIVHFDGVQWSTMQSNTTQNLRSVWVASPTDAFAVGEGGTILRYNGTTWSPMTSPTSVALVDVWGTSANDVFAVGGKFDLADPSQATILHFNGSAWSVMTHPAINRLNAVWGTSSSDVFAAGVGGAILRYNGSTWTAMTSPARHEIWSLSGTAGDDVYAAGWANYGESPPVLHYDGRGWAGIQTTNGVMVTTVFAVGGAVFASSFNGVYRTEGMLWTNMHPPPRVGEACRTGNTCMRPGETCNVTTQVCEDNRCGDPPPFATLAVVAPNDIYAFARSSVYRFDGFNWTCSLPAGLPPVFTVQSARVLPNGDILAVGGDMLLYRRNGSWGATQPVAGVTLRDVWGTSSTNAFVVGQAMQQGRMFSWNGSSLTPVMLAGTVGPLSRIVGRSGTDIYASSRSAAPTILHFNGTQWTPVTFPYSNVVRDIDVSPSYLWVTSFGMDTGSVFRYDGTTWTQVPNEVPIPAFGASVHLRAFADDDVFVLGGDTLNDALVAHWNGIRFDPVRVEGGPVTGVAGSRRALYIASSEGLIGEVRLLGRTRAWTCRTTETDCIDGVDDDCDGLRDGLDSDCP